LNSQSAVERLHITDALRFELGKVNRKEVRQRVLGMLREIDPQLAEDVALAIGVAVPKTFEAPPKGTAAPTHRGDNGGITQAPSLSLDNQPKTSIQTRKVALLVADGFSDTDVAAVRDALAAEGAQLEVVSPLLGAVRGSGGLELDPTKTFATGASVFYDAVFVPGGAASVQALAADPNAAEFIREAYKHFKAIAASGEGSQLLQAAGIGPKAGPGVIIAPAGAADLGTAFVTAIKAHRHWGRLALPRA
jgi:catalase